MDEKSDSKQQPNSKKEDQKITIDDLLAVVRIIRNNQKAQLTRINELEKKVKEVDVLKCKIVKLENALDKEKKETDKQFDNAIDRFETIGNLIDDQVECIENLEAKQNNVAAKLDEIEASIRILDDEIEAIGKRKMLIIMNLKQMTQISKYASSTTLDSVKRKTNAYFTMQKLFVKPMRNTTSAIKCFVERDIQKCVIFS